ncbi:MAG TPA: ribonuclease III [Bacillota bacterium]|nr:ribonuclease III [Bacillota bacterium]
MNRTEFQQLIGYYFKDMELFEKALTHSSFFRGRGMGPGKDNERLEFLGDALLDAVISEELYNRMPSGEEGKLSKTRALVVCEASLAQIGNSLLIGDILRLGKGEDISGGRHRDSIIADAVEAVIGAVFLDGGFDASKNVVLPLFEKTLKLATEGKLKSDYKSEFQEIVQSSGTAEINYVLNREEGPDHDKTFYVNLFVDGQEAGKGTGKSKKEAEQNAAKEAIARRKQNVF